VLKKIILIFFIFCINIYSKNDFFPLNDINSGMKGYIKTVFDNNLIEKFEVEVAGITKSAFDIDNINIQDGAVIIKFLDQNCYGPVGGTSGSPFYIDDKLAGALAYSLGGNNNKYGVVIPIENILKLSSYTVDKYPKIGMTGKSEIPFFVSSGSEYISEKIHKNFGVKPVSVPTFFGIDREGSENLSVEGSPLIVSLVYGDLVIGALGTLTYRDNNKFFAFGHSVFNLGNVNYFVFNAEIIGVVDNREFPYKIALPEKLLGTVTQDRKYGLYGEFEKYPLIIPVNINFSDFTQGKNTYTYRIIKNESVFFKVIDSVIYSAFDNVLPNVLSDFYELDLTISYEDEKFNINNFELKNIILSPEDELKSKVSSLVYRICSELSKNPFKKVNIINVKIDVRKNKNIKKFIIRDYTSFFQRKSNTLIISVNGIEEYAGIKRIDFKIELPDKFKNQNFGVKFYSPEFLPFNYFNSFDELISNLSFFDNDIIVEIIPEMGEDIYKNKIKTDYFFEGKISSENNF